MTHAKSANQPKLKTQGNDHSKRFVPVSLDTGKCITGVDTVSEDTIIGLTGENHGDQLRIPGYSLIAIQALDNYVQVFWEQHGRLQTTMLRTTLTNICGQLEAFSCFFRTHRGWLVNVRRVNNIEGNAQGLKLSFEYLQQKVPVSRANIAGYRELADSTDASVSVRELTP
ncbi:MAG: LytTR family transcriptional regulator [Pedobacter sp.]|nr:MAG: LytTR family transcriptional regulator [Pedobacter sp.]